MVVQSNTHPDRSSSLNSQAAIEGDTSISDNAGSASTAVEAFAFRQSSDYTGTQVIDNLIVGDTFGEAVPVELMSFEIE